MGHFYDYDDTHMGGVVLHTSSPVLAAILSLGENKRKTGKDIILAYVLGFEAGVRVGQTSSSHHDGGWHLTGTLGTMAAGVASASILKLDPEKPLLRWGFQPLKLRACNKTEAPCLNPFTPVGPPPMAF